MPNPSDANPGIQPLRIVHVIRDGGGTAAVELTVATKLRNRGHHVTVFGPPEVRDDTTRAGFELELLEWSPQRRREPEDLTPRMIAAAVPWAQQLMPVLRAQADVMVADCTAFGALMAARITGTVSASMMPTVYVAGRQDSQAAELQDAWAAARAGINRARAELGLGTIVSVTEQIIDADVLLMLTAHAFELPKVQPPANAQYVGPQLPRGASTTFTLPEGTEPLVLVSLSTSDQSQEGVLQRIIDALRSLRVRAVVTVGPAVDLVGLRAPEHVQLERFVPHEAVLRDADLVITHAGHGTVMAAVSAGVPLVCVPMGRDQPAVASRVEHHGLGVSVDPNASEDTLRTAIERVLGDSSYRTAAEKMAAQLEPDDRVATVIESLTGA